MPNINTASGPHHTDVPFNDKERYRENIKACILHEVGEEARFLDKDPTETERIWLEEYGETLDQMIDHNDIPKHLRFNIAHVRSRIEAATKTNEKSFDQ